MARPDILINNSTGTAEGTASGAGPATALTGSSASFSGTVVTLDGSPDLSGVATDGSHALYLATTTGREWFRITAVDNGADTVTVADAPAGTASGLSWAIGGVLDGADLSSTIMQQLWDDVQPGWTVSFAYTGTDYTFSGGALTFAAGGNNTDGPVTIRGTGGQPRIVMTVTSTSDLFWLGTNGSYWVVRDLWLRRTKTSISNTKNVVNFSGGWASFSNVVFEQHDAQVRQVGADGIDVQNNVDYQATFYRCVFRGCHKGVAKDSGGSAQVFSFFACRFVDCEYGSETQLVNPSYDCCVFDGCGVGVFMRSNTVSRASSITHCAFYDCTDGVLVSQIGAVGGLLVIGCAFEACNYAVRNSTSETNRPTCVRDNVYYNLTSGFSLGLNVGVEDNTSLSGSPFEDAANGDFGINNTAGAGAVARAVTIDVPEAT